MKAKKKLKVWMTEGRIQLPTGRLVPVRSVVECSTRKQAERLADESVVKAAKILTKGRKIMFALVGKAIVLYPI